MFFMVQHQKNHFIDHRYHSSKFKLNVNVGVSLPSKEWRNFTNESGPLGESSYIVHTFVTHTVHSRAHTRFLCYS